MIENVLLLNWIAATAVGVALVLLVLLVWLSVDTRYHKADAAGWKKAYEDYHQRYRNAEEGHASRHERIKQLETQAAQQRAVIEAIRKAVG